MRRREFITLIGGVSIAGPLAAQPQKPAMPVIGLLGAGTEEQPELLDAFRHGLAEFNYVEGRNVIIDQLFAQGRYGELPRLAGNFVSRQVSVIFAANNLAAVLAAKNATETVPVLFITGADPVKQGLVNSLNRPGGNLTGISSFVAVIAGKLFSLLYELVPKDAVIATLVNPNNPNAQRQIGDMEAAAQSIGVTVSILKATDEQEIDIAFAKMAEQHTKGLLIGTDLFFVARARQLVELSARYALTTIYFRREFAVAGGLMSYGSSQTEAYHQAGVYAARILSGEKPADLPVWQPTKFDLVINMKAAKAQNVKISDNLLSLADEVIE
jgi:putative ABC transport system substrate-binding protein